MNTLQKTLHQADMDDLFAELLGGLSPAYSVLQKKQYDYVTLDEGIENSMPQLITELKTLIGQPKDAATKVDMDLRALNRPLIIHAKSAGCKDQRVVEALAELQGNLKVLGRAFVVFPAHEELSLLGSALARDLRSALKLTGIVPPLTVDPEITEAFCRSTKELFEIQLKTPIRFIGASIRNPGRRHSQHSTGVIELEGGSVTISAMVTIPSAALPELMKRMSGLPVVPEEMVKNAPAEFANVVSGAARGFLNGAGYALRPLSLPKTYGTDSQHILGAADSSTAVEVKLETELGEGFLEIRFYS